MVKLIFMPIEIERKFLIASDSWKHSITKSITYRQGYLSNNKQASIRIRVSDDTAMINIKSMTMGIQRLEYEYPIPLDEANEQLDKLCQKPLIEKTRHYIQQGKHTWEIDVFNGDNEGLIVAEIELEHEDENFEKPDWLGHEVSHLARYFNICLMDHPFKNWSEREKQGK